jgi:molecular chaperone DnaK (HSP70)
MAGNVIGLDFGTTNSLAAYVDHEGRARALTNIEDDRPHPSAVWYRAGETIVGRDARAHLDAGHEAISGAFVRSPKRLLHHGSTVDVEGTSMDPRDIVADVLRFIKNDAGSKDRFNAARDLERAVMTIPVELDGDGRRRLRDAARKAGISIEQFVHEPLAALYGWLRAQRDYTERLAQLEGRRVLVFDWGGGTLDLTLCLIRGQKMIQLASAGDNDVGGDFFDEVIRTRIRDRHASQLGIDHIEQFETPDSRTRLLQQCERAKMELSVEESFPLFIPNYLRREDGRSLNQIITREDLETWTGQLIDRGLSLIDRLLDQCRLTHQEIEMCLPTGGMVNLPAIRSGLVQRFGGRVPKLENGDRIIAEGAAWIAHDRLRLSLAKPIEIEQPDGSFLEIVGDDQSLPVENEQIPIYATQFYCCDPRDQVANFHFVRPTKVGYGSRTAPRQTYTTLTLKVDPYAQPFTERLNLELSIDHDYVVHVSGKSSGRKDRARKEIHNLEFALTLPATSSFQTQNPGAGETGFETETQRSTLQGAVRLRSNVVLQKNSWRDVPGDLVEIWRENWFDSRSGNASLRQHAERDYYRPCAVCKRGLCQINLEGCDCGHAISKADAAARNSDLGLQL